MNRKKLFKRVLPRPLTRHLQTWYRLPLSSWDLEVVDVATHTQAIKRNRQRIKRTARNRHLLSTMRTLKKRVVKAIEANDAHAAAEALKIASPEIQKLGRKRIIHPKNAARTISRLSQQVHCLSSKA